MVIKHLLAALVLGTSLSAAAADFPDAELKFSVRDKGSGPENVPSPRANAGDRPTPTPASLRAPRLVLTCSPTDRTPRLPSEPRSLHHGSPAVRQHYAPLTAGSAAVDGDPMRTPVAVVVVDRVVPRAPVVPQRSIARRPVPANLVLRTLGALEERPRRHAGGAATASGSQK